MVLDTLQKYIFLKNKKLRFYYFAFKSKIRLRIPNIYISFLYIK